MTTMTKMLVGMGGRRWTQGDRDRVYVGAELGASLIGLRVSCYGSGNVSSATMDGEKISNASAREYLNTLRDCYYDVMADKFFSCCGGIARVLRDRLAEANALAPAVAS